jgi:sugar/nucleoside kinase (ribokinase family)
MMRESDCPIVPIETLAQIKGQQTLDGALQALHALCKKSLVVTLGEFGSLIYDGVTTQMVPAFKITAVNTLGAGDVFRGAFAYGQMEGWSLVKCAMYGNAAAALQCMQLGNAAVVPSADDIDLMMQGASRNAGDLILLVDHFDQLVSQYQPATLVTLT